MIEFTWDRVDNENTPILTKVDIDGLTEQLLQDYNPKLLKEPGPINYARFLEYYLGATVEYMDIFYEEISIWGATCFNEGEIIKVFDRENNCTENRRLKARTIVLDNYIMEEGREGLALFTALHEGGHLWLHPKVYTRTSGQLPLFENSRKKDKGIVCCRESSIGNFGWQNNEANVDWKEYQANCFAARMAMPKSTFIPLGRSMLKSVGISKRRVVEGVDADLDCFAKSEFPARMADIYGVSKQAALIRLYECGLIVKKEDTQLELW